MSEQRRPRKSDLTRVRIRDAASELFAYSGYDGTSIRDVANRAVCDPALVMRYFKSKDALFAEVSAFDLQLPDLRGLSADRVAQQVAAHFVAIWESPERGPGFRALLKSAASHEPSAEKLRQVFYRQVIPAFKIRSGESEQQAAVAGLVSSVLLGVAMVRYIFNVPPIAQMPRDQLIERVAHCLEAILTSAE